MTILARPSEWTRAHKRSAAQTRATRDHHHYFAFISYSHRDEEMADWLQEELEGFRVPSNLVGRITDHGAVPRRLTPIFRDLEELPASDDLGTEIRTALSASRYLIVLCSPDAARSRWTNAEIEEFKRVRPEGCILAAIIAGEPFASDVPGRDQEECLPRALRYKYDRRGRPTDKRAEPLAADLREAGETRRLGLLKLIAGMLDVGLDDLVRRDTVRRQRRLAILAAASLAGMVVTSGLAITAIKARDAARDQRREAEGLVAFMLGDLRSKLEPVGRLDALDGVGSRVLAYYSKQDTTELSDSSLLQRSRALSLMGGVASSRGDLDGAIRLYREAMAGTSEAIRRDPEDPQRLYDHAQNVFAVGEIARSRGQLDAAGLASREYKRLARRMVELQPDNMRWRVELQYADANLGIVSMARRQFADAASQFRQSLATIEALSTADPSNGDYKKGIAETIAWLADAEAAAGNLDAAITRRRQQVALLSGLLDESGDVSFRQKLVTAHRGLGHAYAARGLLPPAEQAFRLAVSEADELMAVEPGNSEWQESTARARLDLARALMRSGKVGEAVREAQGACALANDLFRRDPSVVYNRTAQRDCLVTSADLALRSNHDERALALTNEAIRVGAPAKTGDRVSDSFALARLNRLLGDVRNRSGDEAGARAAWQSGLALIPAGIAEKPSELNDHAQLLERLGREGDAQPLRSRLKSMGYRPSA